jgi:hypothetical protein
MSSTVYQAQREAYRHKLMFELMFREEEQVDLKRYIRAFVSRDRWPFVSCERARVSYLSFRRTCVCHATRHSRRFLVVP